MLKEIYKIVDGIVERTVPSCGFDSHGVEMAKLRRVFTKKDKKLNEA